MHRLMRYYNQNRKMIWSVIIFIAFLIVILQLLNFMTKQNIKKQQNQSIDTQINSDVQYNNVVLESEKSVLSGNKISKAQSNEIKIIDNFFSYCNENELDKAYNLLSTECKEELYKTMQAFEESYYKQVLKGQKSNISIENWIDNIYKVRITSDLLSSGKYKKEEIIQDYITVEEDDNKEYKLNINSYIGRTYLKNEAENKDIKIKVLQKDMYMDYTTYNFEITNNSTRTILLDDLTNVDNIYIQDKNNVKYKSYTHEKTKEELKVDEFETKQVKIKYFSQFSSRRKITKAVFSKLILDYETYQYTPKNQYENYYTFEVGL